MFFKKLFDTKFENFVTRDVARVLYIFMLALLSVGLLMAEILGLLLLASDEGLFVEGILLMLVSPLVALVSLIIIRVGFESSIALVSIAENTKK